MADITIVSTRERPDLIKVAAAWHWAQWGRKHGHTLAGAEGWLGGHTARVGPPQCFVLLEEGSPAAMATFEHHDLDARMDLSPWLANLVVAPEFRGRGHAIRLVRHTEAACRTAGIPELYLNTEGAAPLYARLGWEEIGSETHKGHPVIVMRRVL
jgi:GNAT superfamily N-acetyltransferase